MKTNFAFLAKSQLNKLQAFNTTVYIAKVFALQVSISPGFQVMVLNSAKQSRIHMIRMSLTDQKEHRIE